MFQPIVNLFHAVGGLIFFVIAVSVAFTVIMAVRHGVPWTITKLKGLLGSAKGAAVSVEAFLHLASVQTAVVAKVNEVVAHPAAAGPWER